jgi:hypothetical protein
MSSTSPAYPGWQLVQNLGLERWRKTGEGVLLFDQNAQQAALQQGLLTHESVY